MRLIGPLLTALMPLNAADVLVDRQVPLGSGTIRLEEVHSGDFISVAISAPEPAKLPAAGVRLRIDTAGTKRLHPGDGDFYLRMRAGSSPPVIEIEGAAKASARIRVARLDQATEVEPNNRWEDANPIELGTTIRASADDASYIPVEGAQPDLEAGVDWFRFEFQADQSKLVFFEAGIPDRDNIPVDVSVWRVVNGKAVAFTEGEDPVTLPHEVQALPGNKFTTRVLKEPGTYYVRVDARHPAYSLSTRTYNAPPYADPREAVRAGIDYLLGAGDSWHANTPRRGGIWDRVANVHQETSLCVACHPTHFTMRAALYAKRNGYPIHQRDQLQFLAERFYNNPRPLYGFESDGAVWSRVISAPANVLGRMSHLLDVYEREVSGERRASFHEGVAKYLRLYYQGRTKLPPDETNGNQPLVSAYEVAWLAWEVTRDPEIAALVEQDTGIQNLIDLCYQTQALAAIDRAKYADKIQANAARILELQRPSGQWSMKFEPEEKEVEFQTGHSLWALHDAGIPADHPQVAKGLQYLLSRQQSFGGWLDPLQSFENFRTPFRETQMAVLALSAYFPGEDRSKGWNDSTWQQVPAAIDRLLESPDALTRAEALEILARTAPADALGKAVAMLGDDSKLVQRAAAYAVRQIYVRHSVPPDELRTALASPSERTRWGAARVFATHFQALAAKPEFAAPLIRLTGDRSPAVQMQALKGLWQYWFWTPSDEIKSEIEDAFLKGLKRRQHPWVESNRRAAIYNVADENIRYLYNNWVPALARKEDQDRVIEGRLAVERRQADKFARFLETAKAPARKRLLHALTEFPLRRPDVYSPAGAKQTIPSSGDLPVYSRIGNDIEQVVFFGDSAKRMGAAIEPLTRSADPELKRLARNAALMVREANFAGPNRLAGEAGGQVPTLRAMVEPKRKVPAAGTSTQQSSPARYGKPDDSYFRGYVQPILEARGSDGSACVHCHASHTIFDGTLAGAKRVIDLNDPENSLILRKPTSSAEIEGTLEAQSGGSNFRMVEECDGRRTVPSTT